MSIGSGGYYVALAALLGGLALCLMGAFVIYRAASADDGRIWRALGTAAALLGALGLAVGAVIWA